MNKRAMLVLGIVVLLLLSFSLAAAEKKPIPIPADKIGAIEHPTPTAEKNYCYLEYTEWSPAYYLDIWQYGNKVAIYFDPDDCGYPTNYPFQLHDVYFYIYDFAGVGSVDLRFSVEVMCPDICDGPGIEIWKSQVYNFALIPGDLTPLELYFEEDTVCLDKPFFFNVEYMSDYPLYYMPSLLFDPETAPVDTCYQWVWIDQPAWIEWYNFWTPPPPGWVNLGISGWVDDQADCGWWYWKPDTTEAPSGMPDFDQNQDAWVAFCGPTAVANCLWWFDAVPEDMPPADFIELLAGYFSTTSGGTYVDSIQAGLDRYFEDYGFALQETTYWEPDFHEMEDSLKRCQDIILLLGFWWWDDYYQEWYREGGHFVTMAGVNSEKKEIAISDPDRDQCVRYPWWPGRVRPPEHPPWGAYPSDLHNDPSHVSHDIYVSLLYPEWPSPGSDVWDLADYCVEFWKYSDKNVPQRFRAVTKQAPKHYEYFHTEVEAAIMICPKPQDSLYWKSGYGNYAPSGMPDIDMFQGYGWWKTETGRPTFDGPCALANCFKWFDSRYEDPAGFPGDGFDNFPLVRDYLDGLPAFTGLQDDHDPANVDIDWWLGSTTPWQRGATTPPPRTPQPFVPGYQNPPQPMDPWGELVERIAWYVDLDGVQSGYCNHSGTRPQDMYDGILDWLESETFAGPGGEQQFIRGDINGNGTVETGDITACASGPPFMCDDAADANDDGIWDMTDCVYLTDMLYSGGPDPPPPYPDCGLDPTADGLNCADFPPCPFGPTLAETLCVNIWPMPTFDLVERLIEKCEDVILLLGFWWQEPTGMWWRNGGHWVTVAGINSEDYLIGISDPFIDNAEWGGRGRVLNGSILPHDHELYDHWTHNDEGNVSHDVYQVIDDPISPGGLWEIVDYGVPYAPPDFIATRFEFANIPPEFESMTMPYDTLYPLVTEVEYAIQISPWDYRGDVNVPGGDGQVNVDDIVYLIAYLFRSGPAPWSFVEGDANCDGEVEVGDIVVLISYLFRYGPVPRCCDP